MESVHIFQLASLGIGLAMFLYVFLSGRKLLEQFPTLDDSQFLYMEDKASGYSNHSTRARKGGANKSLKIRLTKDELWLYSNVAFAFLLERFNLLHKVPIRNVESVESEEYTIVIKFHNEGEHTEVVIFSRNKEELMAVLKDKMNQNHNV